MKTYTLYSFYGYFFLLAFSLLGPGRGEVKAGQLLGAEITYTKVPNIDDKYVVTLVIYRDCADPLQLDSYYALDYRSDKLGDYNRVLAMNFDSAQVYSKCESEKSICLGGTYPGLEKHYFSGYVTLPDKSDDWKFSFTDCSRALGTNTPFNETGGECMYIEAVINNNVSSSSPRFALLPQFYLCHGQEASVDNGVIERESDSLVFQLITPKKSSVQNLSYKSGFSPANPLSTAEGYIFSQSTGSSVFTPTVLNQHTAIALRVSEYRNGVFIGSVIREYQHRVEACDDPLPDVTGFDNSNNYEIEVCAGSTLEYSFTATDPEGDSVILDWNAAIAEMGAKFIVYHSSDSLALILADSIPSNADSVYGLNTRGYLIWEPTNADVGLHPFSITAIDKSCRYKKTRTYSIRVKATPEVSITGKFGNKCDSLYPISPVIAGGVPPYSNRWVPSGITSPGTVLLKPKTYRLYVTGANNCVGIAKLGGETGLRPKFAVDTSCVNAPIVFKDSSRSDSSTLVKWEWFFDGAGPVAVRNPSRTFNTPGLHTVLLKITDNRGCEDEVQRDVMVLRRPSIEFELTSRCIKSVGVYDQLKVDKNSHWSYVTERIYPVGIPAQIFLNNTFVGPEYRDTAAIAFPYKKVNSLDLPDDLGNLWGFKHIRRMDDIDFLQGTYTFERTVNSVYKEELEKDTFDYYICPASAQKNESLFLKPGVLILENTYSIKCSGSDSVLTTFAQSPSGGSLIFSWTRSDSRLPGYVTPLPGGKANISGDGTYEVKVTDVTNKCEASSTIKILYPLAAAFNFKPYCSAGDSIIYFNQSGSAWGVDSLAWNFGNGTIHQKVSPVSYLYPKDTVHTVKLFVRDSTGCTDSTEMSIIQLLPDTSAFDVVNAESGITVDTLCFGIKVLGKAPKAHPYLQNINEVKWDFGENVHDTLLTTSPAQPNSSPPFDATHTYITGAKKFNVSLTTQYNRQFENKYVPAFCEVTQKHSIYVWDSLKYDTLLSQATYQYCADSLFTYGAKKINAQNPLDSIRWEFWYSSKVRNEYLDSDSLLYTDSRNLSTAPYDSITAPDTVRFSMHGINKQYWVKLWVRDKAGCVSEKIYPFANEIVDAPSFQTEKLCANESTLFRYTSLSTTGNSKDNIEEALNKWDFGNGLTDTVGNDKGMKYNIPGVYQVKLTVRNRYGCPNDTTKDVTIKPVPTADFTVDPVCLGDSSVFTDRSLPADTGKIINRIWLAPELTPAEAYADKAEIKYRYTAAGMYPVSLIVRDQNMCTDTTYDLFAAVHPNPVPKIQVNKNDMYAFADMPLYDNSEYPGAQQGNKWIWYFGDGDSLVMENESEYVNPVTHHYDSIGIYNVKLYTENEFGCGAFATRPVDLFPYLLAPTAFSPNEDELHDNLKVLHKGIDRLEEFKIYNRWGELIFDACPEFDAPCSIWNGTVNGNPQPNGVYTIFAVGSVNREGYNSKYSYRGKVTLVR